MCVFYVTVLFSYMFIFVLPCNIRGSVGLSDLLKCEDFQIWHIIWPYISLSLCFHFKIHRFCIISVCIIHTYYDYTLYVFTILQTWINMYNFVKFAAQYASATLELVDIHPWACRYPSLDSQVSITIGVSSCTSRDISVPGTTESQQCVSEDRNAVSQHPDVRSQSVRGHDSIREDTSQENLQSDVAGGTALGHMVAQRYTTCNKLDHRLVGQVLRFEGVAEAGNWNRKVTSASRPMPQWQRSRTRRRAKQAHRDIVRRHQPSIWTRSTRNGRGWKDWSKFRMLDLPG